MYLDAYTDPILQRISVSEYLVLKSQLALASKKYGIIVKTTFNDLDRRYASNRFIHCNGDMMMCDKRIYGNVFSEDLSVIENRIHESFRQYNSNCKLKCTQPIAKAKEI